MIKFSLDSKLTILVISHPQITLLQITSVVNKELVLKPLAILSVGLMRKASIQTRTASKEPLDCSR
jgi:hypothetical protein